MEHKIVEKDEFKIVGLEIKTSVEECKTNNKMPELWGKFISRMSEIKNAIGDVLYGVSFTISKPDCTFRSIACTEVSEFDSVPEGMVSETVPKEKYAVYEHKGKLDSLNDTYGAIMQDLEEKGFKEKDVWLEVYGKDWKEDSDDSIMEIWVSIE